MESRIATSIEQSKKLIELGINVNTADMRWEAESVNFNREIPIQYEERPKVGFLKPYLPAWSLSALLGLIKNSVGSNVTVELVYLPSTTNGRGERLNETFRFSVDDIFTEMDIYEKEPIDAVYSMVVWLSENKKI